MGEALEPVTKGGALYPRYRSTASSRAARAPAATRSMRSLVARSGEVTALLGANGAGKSTLLSLWPAFWCQPRARRAGRKGRGDVERRGLARAVALVPQSERWPGLPGPGRRGDGARAAPGRVDAGAAGDDAAVEEALDRCDLGPGRPGGRDAERRRAAARGRGPGARAEAGRARARRAAAFLDVRHRLELYDCWPTWPSAMAWRAWSRCTISTRRRASRPTWCCCARDAWSPPASPMRS